MRHSRRMTYALVGSALIPVGLAGIALPLIPGIPILCGAAVCFAMAAGPMRAASGLTAYERVKLDFLFGAERLVGWAKRRQTRR